MTKNTIGRKFQPGQRERELKRGEEMTEKNEDEEGDTFLV